MANVEALVLDKTDLDLNTSESLPMADVKVGLGPDSLSPETSAALTRGFQTDVPNEDIGPRGEGATPSDTDPRGYPLSGFVRDEAIRPCPSSVK
jgi:hypothetical protein